MASITLSGGSLLALATDLPNPIRIFTADREDDRSLDGDVEIYAGGRMRATSLPGDRRKNSMTLVNATPAQVAVLTAWRGKVVLFRDVRGRKIFGVFFGVKVRDYRDGSGHTVALELVEVTYSEAV